jgi:hypothetical protein
MDPGTDVFYDIFLGGLSLTNTSHICGQSRSVVTRRVRLIVHPVRRKPT